MSSHSVETTMGVFALLVSALLIVTAHGSSKGFGPGEQDYGYVTVREGAHMFWWLYHTTANVPNSYERPLILWLMGGPGGSSGGHGNFEYVGPIDENLNPREDTWVKEYNILFVDNPVGAGFSYVDSPIYFTTNNKQIADDLLELLKGFYLSMPEFKSSPLYIYGISYGGKMATDFARLLYDEIQAGNIDANLQGLSMGNAWVSPIDFTVSYADYLYQVSLIDETAHFYIQQQALFTKFVFDQGLLFNTTMEWSNTFGLIYYFTDDVDIYNILTKVQKPEIASGRSRRERLVDSLLRNKYYSKATYELLDLMNGPVKEALNIPSHVVWDSQSVDVFFALFSDFMTPVTDTIQSLLNSTDLDIHVCNGNMDLIVHTPGVNLWINKLRWPEENEFRNAPRETIWIDNTMEGYQREGGRFHFYWINVAGHDAITENTAATRHFLKSITGV